MKTIPLKAKLWILSSSLILLAVLAASVTWYSSYRLSESLEKVTGAEIPALRALGLADMYHDGLRGLAYQLAYKAQFGSAKDFEDSVTELQESMNAMSENIRKAGAVEISDEYQEAYKSVVPKVDQYNTALKETGRREILADEVARDKALAAVNEAFEVLEKELGNLGEIFEKEANKLEGDAARMQATATMLGLGTILFAALFGFSFSYFTVRKIDSQLTSIVDSLTSQSRELQDQVERVNGYSGELSDGVMSLSGATEETAASLEELRTTLQNTLSNSESGQTLSKQGSQHAEVGLSSVSRLLDTMKQLKAASAQLKAILDMMEEIGNVTSVIDDIVFQTKLLAFNASIEAERAGEHGRGFAVVAAEVGKLANQSGGSATSIRELLVTSENRTKEFITELAGRVDECNAAAEKCGVVFNEISQSLVMIRDRSNDIAVASREQSAGVAQISEAMNQIETSTGRASESAQTLSQTSRDLSEIYRVLLGQVVSLETILRGGRVDSHQVAQLDTVGGASISTISQAVDERAA